MADLNFDLGSRDKPPITPKSQLTLVHVKLPNVFDVYLHRQRNGPTKFFSVALSYNII